MTCPGRGWVSESRPVVCVLYYQGSNRLIETFLTATLRRSFGQTISLSVWMGKQSLEEVRNYSTSHSCFLPCLLRSKQGPGPQVWRFHTTHSFRFARQLHKPLFAGWIFVSWLSPRHYSCPQARKSQYHMIPQTAVSPRQEHTPLQRPLDGPKLTP